MSTHYEVLGLEPDADEAAIKKASLRHARQFHPDVAGDEANDTYLAGVEAAKVLLDPEARAAYDDDLAHPERVAEREAAAEADLDDWVTEEAQVVDEPVVDEPEPVDMAKGEPKRDVPSTSSKVPAEDGPATITSGMLSAPIISAAGLVAAISLALRSSHAFSIGLLVVLAAFVVGFVVGYFELTTPRARRGDRRRLSIGTRGGIIVLAVLAVAGHAAMALVPELAEPTLRLVLAAIPALLAGGWVGIALWFSRLDAKVLPLKTLRNHISFGQDGADLEAIYLKRALEQMKSSERVRVFSTPKSVFSHAVVGPDRVWLMRGVGAGAGHYSANDTVVTRTDRTGRIEIVAEGDFGQQVAAMRRELGKRMPVEPVFVASGPAARGDVVRLSDLEALFADVHGSVSRAVCVDVLLAAASPSA